MATTNKGGKKIQKFKIPGMEPDVRLKITDEFEFHVHSIMLRIHSGFFRKFLDSPEKILPASKEFTYEWVAQLDDKDGSQEKWHLVAAQSASEDKKINPRRHWGTGFGKLLRAMYNQPYIIWGLDDLTVLMEIADYYCALKIVSSTLDGVILKQQSFKKAVFENPIQAFKIAVKLRHHTLYRECLILSVGPWTKPQFEFASESDYDLYSRAAKIQQEIHAIIGRISITLCDVMIEWKANDPEKYKLRVEFMQKAQEQAVVTYANHSRCNAPGYFRRLNNYQEYDGWRPFEPYVTGSGILSNHMLLNSDLNSGSGEAREYFLCDINYIDVVDEVPWNTEEDDW